MVITIINLKKYCVNRESNPGHLLGRQIFYLYTINATFLFINFSFSFLIKQNRTVYFGNQVMIYINHFKITI